MWIKFTPSPDERSEEAQLRSEAWRMCGVLLRVYYFWLADKASSPHDWDAVPAWAERLPLDISSLLSSLAEGAKTSTSGSIEGAAKRIDSLMSQLENHPDSGMMLRAVSEYAAARRKHEQK